jgi:ubiquinone/menaquinone biosynthesis C-methylase UbiE
VSGRTDANEERYDRMAGSYRLFTRLSSCWTIGRLYRAAAGALDVPAGGSLVDMGCGPATLTPYLVRKLGSSVRISGVDFSREMIRLAQREALRRGWPNLAFVHASALEFEPAAPVDAVVFCLSLSLLPEPERCLERALSFTKPAGQLVIVDSIPDPQRPIASLLIRAKAGRVGAEPDAFPLALLRARLTDFRERRMLGGVYTLVTGRKAPAPDLRGAC